jgi:hypothetical protein
MNPVESDISHFLRLYWITPAVPVLILVRTAVLLLRVVDVYSSIVWYRYGSLVYSYKAAESTSLVPIVSTDTAVRYGPYRYCTHCTSNKVKQDRLFCVRVSGYSG